MAPTSRSACEHAQHPAEHLVDEGRALEELGSPVEHLDQDGAGEVDHDEADPERQHRRVLMRELGPVLAEPGAQRVPQVDGEEERHHEDREADQPAQRSLDEPGDEEAEHEEEHQQVEEVEALDGADDVHADSPCSGAQVAPLRPASPSLRPAARKDTSPLMGAATAGPVVGRRR